jgi:hypothetical protein
MADNEISKIDKSISKTNKGDLLLKCFSFDKFRVLFYF